MLASPGPIPRWLDRLDDLSSALLACAAGIVLISGLVALSSGSPTKSVLLLVAAVVAFGGVPVTLAKRNGADTLLDGALSSLPCVAMVVLDWRGGIDLSPMERVSVIVLTIAIVFERSVSVLVDRAACLPDDPPVLMSDVDYIDRGVSLLRSGVQIPDSQVEVIVAHLPTHPEGSALLCEFLTSESAVARRAAADALGKVTPSSQVEAALTARVRDDRESESVRRRALASLRILGIEPALDLDRETLPAELARDLTTHQGVRPDR